MRRGLAALIVALSWLSPAAALSSDSTATTTKGTSSEEVRKLPGGAVLRLAPGTRINIGRPTKVQLRSSSSQTLAQCVQLSSGRVEVDLPPSKHPTTAVLIQGPHKISAVAKGGHSVVIAANNRVTVAALGDDMLAASGNDWRAIPAAVVREFPNGGGYSDHAVLTAPEAHLSAPVTLTVAEGSNPGVEASVSSVAHAAAYEFQVWRVHGEAREFFRRESSKDGKLRLRDLAPGSYGVSAHAIESSGLEGAESAMIPLRVVSAELPSGAKLVDGGILLSPRQRVRLLGTEGVEISYGKASQFIAAPSTIGLIRGQPTLVRLRAAGSSDELSLTLTPSTVHAEVQVGPARARWPRDRVVATVRLTDSRGQPLGNDVQVKPRVSVNVKAVDVKWTRNRNLLTATVPPLAEPGPWVVRVEVADATGAVVGRDFLEVAETKRELADAKRNDARR